MLPHRTHQACHIDDVAFCLPQVWQGELASSEDADEVEVNKIAKLLDRKIVDRFVSRMPPGIVDQTINLSVAGDGGFNQILDLVALSDITVDETGIGGAVCD